MAQYTTYFLKFPDEETAKVALELAGVYIPPVYRPVEPVEEGEDLPEPEIAIEGYYKQADIGWAFDPIGTITEGGVYDIETGEELTPPTVLDGWHANYIGESLPDSLTAYNLNPGPATPYRVFA